MPCSTCLDDYGSERDQQPVALQCGHLFHRMCVEQWFAQREARQRCGVCKTECTLGIIALYPDSLDDVDGYLALRRQRREQASRGLSALREADGSSMGAFDSIVPPELQEDLLSELLDFRHAANAYVMGVHGLRLNVVTRAGEEMVEVLGNWDQMEEERPKLQRAVTSLSRVANELNSCIARAEKREQELIDANHGLSKAHDSLARDRHEFKKKTTALQAREEALEVRVLSADAQRKKDEKQRLEQEKELDAKREAVARDHERVKDGINALQRDRVQMLAAANLKLNEAEQIVADMAKERTDAVRAAEHAEKDKDAVLAKNNLLAEQMRVMQARLERMTKKHAEEQQQLERENAALKSRVERLKKTAAASQSARPRESPIALQRPLRSSSPLLDDDSQFSAFSNVISNSPPSSQALQGLVYSKHDLAAELSDSEFPRPGGLGARRAVKPAQVHAKPLDRQAPLPASSNVQRAARPGRLVYEAPRREETGEDAQRAAKRRRQEALAAATAQLASSDKVRLSQARSALAPTRPNAASKPRTPATESPAVHSSSKVRREPAAPVPRPRLDPVAASARASALIASLDAEAEGSRATKRSRTIYGADMNAQAAIDEARLLARIGTQATPAPSVKAPEPAPASAQHLPERVTAFRKHTSLPVPQSVPGGPPDFTAAWLAEQALTTAGLSPPPHAATGDSASAQRPSPRKLPSPEEAERWRAEERALGQRAIQGVQVLGPRRRA